VAPVLTNNERTQGRRTHRYHMGSAIL